MAKEKLRNIAIVAHVDHGKTTLVDAMFKQSGVFREGAEVTDRIMDSGDLERERGITITAKNCAITRDDVKINILDTPGHADFGGEVERALMMVDGVVLLVDAAEGPLPQTRFVVQKALAAGLNFIICLNKIDRSDARPKEVLNEVYDLFIDLDANEDQLDFPVLYAVGKNGIASHSLETPGTDLAPLFETILNTIPAPKCGEPDEPFRMQVTNLDYSDYLGLLAIGRVQRGTIRTQDPLVRLDEHGTPRKLKAVKVQNYTGTRVTEVSEAGPGEIILLAGIDDVTIGDTIANAQTPEALPRIEVDAPTVAMNFFANSSPLSGKEGSIVQSQRIGERLMKEQLYNVGLQVEKSPNGESFVVKGRGEFQLCILIESMRREGFELSVGRPQVLLKEVDGVSLEPIEHLVVDCAEESVGVITESLSVRKGRMTNMINHGSGRVRLEFSIPARGLIGYRNKFLTDTRGTGIMHSYLEGYEPHRGDFPSRSTGSLVADRDGVAIAYALFNLEARGKLFVVPGQPMYEGLIIGECSRGSDLNVNPTKGKKLTNVRASGKDEAVQLTPITPPTLEQAIDFIRDDELVEVTPQSVRLRKAVLNANGRRDRL